MLQFVLAESPKYTYSKGDEQKTLRILQRVYRMNTGKSDQDYEVKEIRRTEEFGSILDTSSSNFFKDFWDQSTQLFRGKHLRNILTACFLQFAVCGVSNGTGTYISEIINKIYLYLESDSPEDATLCKIFNSFDNDHGNSTGDDFCVEQTPTETFIYFYIICALFALVYLILSFTINWAGKLWNLEMILLVAGLSAIGIVFVKLPIVSSLFTLVLLLSGISILVINASTIEIFPTKMR